jgi:DNA polymerase (family X)
MLDKKEVIILLENIADLLEFRGENTFKVGAYRKGAAAIRKINEDINDVVKNNELHTIPGIGKGLQSVIYEYYELGFSNLLNELSKDIPAGIRDLMRVKGLGPRKILQLHTSANISTIDELEKAARNNKLTDIKGFSESLQKQVIEEIERIRLNAGYVLLNNALEIGEELKDKLLRLDSVVNVEITGTLKRRREVVNHIELLAEITCEAEFKNDLLQVAKYEQNDGYVLLETTYPPLIKVFTCTKKGWFLKDFILSAQEDFLNKLPVIKEKNYRSENDIFESISFPYVIPEMREIEFFNYNNPQNSNLNAEDFKGFLHFHSTYSDGRNSLEDMLKAAESRNYEYAAVCDHSKSAYYANGLKEDAILLQFKEIERLSAKQNIAIFRGIESDILKDGSLDYPDEILKSFQFVVASVHSRFALDEMEMTRRMIKAVENPFTDVLGHPSGRLLLLREPYKFDVSKVLDACSKNQVAVEINSNPRRLDLDWRYIYEGREKGCIFTVNSDAHSIAEIDLVEYGVMMSRKAGLQKDEVINCFDKKKFTNFLNQKRKRI